MWNSTATLGESNLALGHHQTLRRQKKSVNFHSKGNPGPLLESNASRRPLPGSAFRRGYRFSRPMDPRRGIERADLAIRPRRLAGRSRSRPRSTDLSGPTGGPNLLFGPTHNELGFGGHRVWLGPQTEWEVFWPPPDNWELSAADRITVLSDGSLSVLSPPPDPVPLRSTGTIAGSPMGVSNALSSGLKPAPVGARRSRSSRSPPVPPWRPRSVRNRPRPAVTCSFPCWIDPRCFGSFASRRTSAAPVGGFSSNELRTKKNSDSLNSRYALGGCRCRLELILHPGPSRGVVVDDPSEGYPTQVYLGSDAWPG